MKPTRLVLAAFALVAWPLFATPSHAQPRRIAVGGFREGYELTVNLNFNSFENKMELDDDTGAGFRFGYLFNPHHEIEFMFNGVRADDSFVAGETADISNWQVSYVFNFTPHGVVPYLTAGLGLVHTDDSDLGTETDSVVGLGGGVRFFLGRVGYVRFEARSNSFKGDGRVFARDENFNFLETSVGFGWRFPVR